MATKNDKSASENESDSKTSKSGEYPNVQTGLEPGHSDQGHIPFTNDGKSTIASGDDASGITTTRHRGKVEDTLDGVSGPKGEMGEP